jgi:hypothetical protein
MYSLTVSGRTNWRAFQRSATVSSGEGGSEGLFRFTFLLQAIEIKYQELYLSQRKNEQG